MLTNEYYGGLQCHHAVKHERCHGYGLNKKKKIVYKESEPLKSGRIVPNSYKKN
jgi:hypothetical protein